MTSIRKAAKMIARARRRAGIGQIPVVTETSRTAPVLVERTAPDLARYGPPALSAYDNVPRPYLAPPGAPGLSPIINNVVTENNNNGTGMYPPGDIRWAGVVLESWAEAVGHKAAEMIARARRRVRET